MAMKDPIVPLFAIMTVSQLLGLSFVNFFPTYVAFVHGYKRLMQKELKFFRLTQTLGFNTTVTLSLAAYEAKFVGIFFTL